MLGLLKAGTTYTRRILDVEKNINVFCTMNARTYIVCNSMIRIILSNCFKFLHNLIILLVPIFILVILFIN